MDVTTIITVNGTKASQRGIGLDEGATSTFTIRPGEYDRSLGSVAELVAQIARSASSRGEWISSLVIGEADVVQNAIAEALGQAHGDIEATVQGLLEMAMFCNAEASSLFSLVAQIAAAHLPRPAPVLKPGYHAIERFVAHWVGHKGFRVSPSGTCLFPATVSYRYGDLKIEVRTEVLVGRPGYDDAGTVMLAEQGQLSRKTFPLMFMDDFHRYQYEERDHTFHIEGASARERFQVVIASAIE